MNKKQRAELRRLAELTYQRELGHYLARLLLRFDEWRNGEISAFELNEFVHEHHRGPAKIVRARHLGLKDAERVAWGLAHDLLERGEVDPDLLEHVQGMAKSLRDLHRGPLYGHAEGP